MKPFTRSFMTLLPISMTLLVGPAVNSRAGDLDACHYWDLVCWMYNVPSTAPENGYNNDAMYIWNQYLDVFRYRDDTDPGWGLNLKNEFGGYASDDDLHFYWGGSWGPRDLAMTIMWYAPPWVGCCKFQETDIVFNAAKSFTFDRLEAYRDPGKVFYPAVLMHELGHVLGFKTGEEEDYKFSVPTVMHSYDGGVQDSMPTIHAPDANLLRAFYADQANPRTITNFMVVSRYADGYWANSTIDKSSSSYAQGERIRVQGLTVENPGIATIRNAHICLYLSADTDIGGAGDVRVEDWYWDTFPAGSWGVYDFTGTVPITTTPGIYYVGARASCNGYGTDDIPWDDSTFLNDRITVIAAAPARVAASDGDFLDWVSVSWDAVYAAPYYQVFRADSATGSPFALTGWITGTSYRDTTAVPGVTYYYWVKAAASASGAFASDYNSYPTTGWRDQLRPDIGVLFNGTNLVDGYSTVSFGTIGPGQVGPTFTFTVTNSGPVNLTLQTVTLSGNDADDFAVDTAGMLTNLASGGSTTLKATFQPAFEGTFYTSLHITCNDPDESPFKILLLGTMTGLDRGFNPIASNIVYSLAVQDDGKVLAGGMFTGVDGTARNHLARLNADGTIDPGFDPNVNNNVYTTTPLPDGKLLIGGSFTNVHGSARNRFARLNPDGTLDPNFNPNANSWIASVVLQADGKILVAGGFTNIGGTSRSYVARLNSEGTVDPGFNPGVNNVVYCLAVQADGNILLGGAFTTVAGTSRNYIARVSANGTLDSAFNPVADNTVYTLALQADGKILLGGDFWNVGGAWHYYIARLNTNGSVDPGFNANPANTVETLAVQADGKILLGGSFGSIYSTNRAYLARLNPAGTLDAGFNPNVNNWVYALALQADGKILLGGRFTGVAQIPRSYIARLQNDPATQVITISNSSQIQWLRGGAAPEVEQVAFDLSTNGGSTWTNLGSGTRINGGWFRAGLNLPASGLVRARGRASGGIYNGSSSLIEQTLSYGSPDIGVTAGNSNIVSGVSIVSFGAVIAGETGPALSFTVTNKGGASLELGMVSVNGSAAGDYLLNTASMATVLAPGESTIFTVAFRPTSVGTKNASISIASNAAGGNPFVFGVDGVGISVQQTPPMILTQPASQLILVGRNTTFSVTATGTESLSYQWQFQGADLPGATLASYTVESVKSTDAGSYTVLVTNSAGTALSLPAVLTVGTPASITRNPLDLCVVAGQAAIFAVAASGTDPLYYQWYFDGVPVTDSARAYAGFTRTNVQVSDAGGYFVVVSNQFNTATSAVARLTVPANPGALLAQWNFNSSPPDSNERTGTLTPSVGVGAASTVGGVTNCFVVGSTNDPVASDNSAWFTGNYPAQGTSNKLGGVRFAVSTAGHRSPLIRWDIAINSVGSKFFRLQYTTNGADFLDGPMAVWAIRNGVFEGKTVNLAGLPGVDDNPNFVFRLVAEFESSAAGTTNTNYLGNSGPYESGAGVRFDMVTVWATPINQPQPRLNMSFDHGLSAVTVSWPLSADVWILECTNALPPDPVPWPQIQPPYQTNGSNLYFAEPVSAGNKFYRLRKQ